MSADCGLNRVPLWGIGIGMVGTKSFRDIEQKRKENEPTEKV
jgi:hypothetical protein